MTHARLVAWRWRALLGVAFMLTGMVTTVLGPVLPWLSARWTLSDQALGSLFTAQFTGGLMGGAASGLVSARLGVARTLTAGFALMSGGLAALGLGGHLVGSVGAWVSGVGLGLVIPTANLLVARREADRTAAALGALNLAWGLGAALWPLAVIAAGPLTDVGWALLALAALCAATALPIQAVAASAPSYVRDNPPTPSPRPAAARVLLFGVLLLLYGGVETALGGWLPEHARRLPGGASTVHWEFAATAFWGGLTAGRALVALALSRRREDQAALAGLALASCSVLALLRTSDERAVIAAAVAGGLGLAPVFPVTVAALSREVPARIGGPLLALGGLGGATIPWVIGAVSDRTGSLASGLRLLIVVSFVLLGLHLVRVSTRERSPI